MLTLCLAFLLSVSIFAGCDTTSSGSSLTKALKSTKQHIEDTSKLFKVVENYVFEEDGVVLETDDWIIIFDDNKIYEEEKTQYFDTETTFENITYYNKTVDDEYQAYRLIDGEWEFEDNCDTDDIPNRAYFSDIVASIQFESSLYKYRNGRYEAHPPETDFESSFTYFKVQNGKISEIYREGTYFGEEETQKTIITINFYYTDITSLVLPGDNPGDNPDDETGLNAAEFAAIVQASKDYINSGDYYEFKMIQPTTLYEDATEEYTSIKIDGSLVCVLGYYDSKESCGYYQFEDATRTRLIKVYSSSFLINDGKWEVFDDSDSLDLFQMIYESSVGYCFTLFSTLLDGLEQLYPYFDFIDGKYILDEDKKAGYEEVFGDDDAAYYFITVADGKIDSITIGFKDGEILVLSYTYNPDGSLTLPVIEEMPEKETPAIKESLPIIKK